MRSSTLGLTVVGPVADRVVDLAVGPGHGAAGPGTAAVAGMTIQVAHLWGGVMGRLDG